MFPPRTLLISFPLPRYVWRGEDRLGKLLLCFLAGVEMCHCLYAHLKNLASVETDGQADAAERQTIWWTDDWMCNAHTWMHTKMSDWSCHLKTNVVPFIQETVIAVGILAKFWLILFPARIRALKSSIPKRNCYFSPHSSSIHVPCPGSFYL